MGGSASEAYPMGGACRRLVYSSALPADSSARRSADSDSSASEELEQQQTSGAPLFGPEDLRIYVRQPCDGLPMSEQRREIREDGLIVTPSFQFLVWS